MKNQVIKPIATALWLLQNTKLTFSQIGAFTLLSTPEIKAIADGFSMSHLEANNPVKVGQITLEEIARCESDENASLRLSSLPIFNDIEVKISKKSYTPMVKRKDKISGVLFLFQRHPKLSASQLMKLTSATKKMAEGVIAGTYPNLSEVNPKDPIISGLCTQVKLNEELEKITVIAPKKD